MIDTRGRVELINGVELLPATTLLPRTRAVSSPGLDQRGERVATAQDDMRPEIPTHIDHKHWWNLIGRILGALRRLDMRDASREDITLIVDEYLPAQSGVTQISIPPQVQNPVIIETILAYSSAGTATLQIGDRLIPIPMGSLVNMQGLQIIRNDARPSVLTTGTAGTLFLEIMGREIPRIVE